MNSAGQSKQISQVGGGGISKSLLLNFSELQEPYFDSPDALQSLKNSDAKVFLASHADAIVRYAYVVNFAQPIHKIPSGKYWSFLLASSSDTLQCWLDAVTGNSVDCSTITKLEGIPESVGFRLDQNFPNPVSLHSTAGTTIRYAVSVRRQVRLSVSDLLGREIAVLQNGFVDIGEYSITLPSSTLTHCGLYFYRLETTNGSITKKLIVQE